MSDVPPDTSIADDRLVHPYGTDRRNPTDGPPEVTFEIARRVPEAPARRTQQDLVPLLKRLSRLGPPRGERHSLLKFSVY
ncbi:hypothetical protein OG873_04625 [Streptomyces violaceus]|uniref:Uncharacterized protein n=1 Tax=Streptomyces violaceus TaxID=1936 RepID=A0ABZ1P3X4_STRVL